MHPDSSTRHIECTPGVCGGRARISGHRIRVQDIIAWHDVQGMSPEEIVARHPQLGLASVYAALAYYHDHRARIDSEIAEDSEFAERIRRQTASRAVTGAADRDAG